MDHSPASHGDVTNLQIVRRIDQHPGVGYDRLWQPYLAQWSDDHLVVAFGGHLAGKTDMGDILGTVSKDGGVTWSEPISIFDHRLPLGPLRVAYANPVLYRPPGQSVLWCFAMRCPLHYRDSEDSELCAAYSRDGGLSWQQVELAVDYHSPLITCGGVLAVPVDGGGVRYLLPVHRNTLRHDPRGTQDQLVLESSNLLEWRLAGYIPAPNGGEVFLHEGNLAPGERAGEVLIVSRTAQGGAGRGALNPPVAFSSISRDGGHTWDTARPEPALHNATSKAFFSRDGRGHLLYVYSVGAYGERRGLAYKVKPPGEPWSEARTFFDIGVKNSYPTLLEYAPGHFHAVWDSSDSPDRARTMIRYGRLSIEGRT
ncbi:MAG TPA: sialidase family protein [Chloroflexota bacterium]|nr:sialidase family protein [Chloroflexota bacterium]